MSARVFEAKPAVRGHVPLLIGLTGPSGGGKTYSALRLATGIQRVTGGDIYGIDTESRRMLHYADKFAFKHVQFDAPFGSLDYLEAIRYCVDAGARVIVVDSASHEHDGPGGLLDFQDQEVERLSYGGDEGKRDKVKMLAWVKPKGARRKLVNGILQMNCNIIFCFRAKHISKPVRANGKIEIVDQGFVPIAGDEWLFEMTLNAYLLPKADGVPSWKSDHPGESMAMKLPEQFKAMFAERRTLSEEIGQQLAEWAKGVNSPTSRNGKPLAVVDAFGARLNAAENLAELNNLLSDLPGMAQEDKVIAWKLISCRAQIEGLEFDKERKEFKVVLREGQVATS